MRIERTTPDSMEITGVSRSSFKEAVQDALSQAPRSPHGPARMKILRYVARINEESCLEFQALVRLAHERDSAAY